MMMVVVRGREIVIGEIFVMIFNQFFPILLLLERHKSSNNHNIWESLLFLCCFSFLFFVLEKNKRYFFCVYNNDCGFYIFTFYQKKS